MFWVQPKHSCIQFALIFLLKLTTIKAIYIPTSPIINVENEVITWGQTKFSDAKFSPDIVQVEINKLAFACLKTDGSVFTFGNIYTGGDTTLIKDKLVNVEKLYSTRNSFIAKMKDGSAFGWSGIELMGDYSEFNDKVTSGVKEIVVNEYAVAVLKTDKSVVVGGTESLGGSIREDLKNVDTIVATRSAFAALTDGKVICWGSSSAGGTCRDSMFPEKVTSIVGNPGAFAALMENGAVVFWGNSLETKISSEMETELESGVLSISIKGNQFLAMKGNGKVILWGTYMFPNAFSSIKKIVQGSSSIAVLEEDGAVYLADPIEGIKTATDVKDICMDTLSNGAVALKNDGSTIFLGKSSVSSPFTYDEQITQLACGEVLLLGLTRDTKKVVKLRDNASINKFEYDLSFGVEKIEVFQDVLVVHKKDETILIKNSNLNSRFSGNIEQLYTGYNAHAFVLKLDNGTFETFGLERFGGIASSKGYNLVKGARRVFIVNKHEIIAQKSDGFVFTWTNRPRAIIASSGYGITLDSSIQSEQIKEVFPTSNTFAYAIITESGTTTHSLDLVTTNTGVKQIVAGLKQWFVALKESSVKVLFSFSANMKAMENDLAGKIIQDMVGTSKGFAVLVNNKVKVYYESGVPYEYESVVSTIESNEDFFVFTLQNGDVVVHIDGENSIKTVFKPENGVTVTQMVKTKKQFAVLLSTGTVIYFDAVTSQTKTFPSPAKRIWANDVAFAALLEDDSVHVWGDEQFMATDGDLVNIQEVYIAVNAFAFKTKTGSLLVAGSESMVGYKALVGNQLTSGVDKVYAAGESFMVTKTDSAVLCFGSPKQVNGFQEIKEKLVDIQGVASGEAGFAVHVSRGSVTQPTPSPTLKEGETNAPSNDDESNSATSNGVGFMNACVLCIVLFVHL